MSDEVSAGAKIPVYKRPVVWAVAGVVGFAGLFGGSGLAQWLKSDTGQSQEDPRKGELDLAKGTFADGAAVDTKAILDPGGNALSEDVANGGSPQLPTGPRLGITLIDDPADRTFRVCAVVIAPVKPTPTSINTRAVVVAINQWGPATPTPDGHGTINSPTLGKAARDPLYEPREFTGPDGQQYVMTVFQTEKMAELPGQSYTGTVNFLQNDGVEYWMDTDQHVEILPDGTPEVTGDFGPDF